MTELKGGKSTISLLDETKLAHFVVLFLPHCAAGEEQTDAACRIIEKLTLKGQGYVADTYLNPGSLSGSCFLRTGRLRLCCFSTGSAALGLHYGLLQATAFNEEYDVERDFTDTTIPNYEMIHQRAGEQMAAWKELLADDPEAHAPVVSTTATSTKRKAVSRGCVGSTHQGFAHD